MNFKFNKARNQNNLLSNPELLSEELFDFCEQIPASESETIGGGSILGFSIPYYDQLKALTDPTRTSFNPTSLDSSSLNQSKEMGAQAFTHGNDIFYGSGKSPGISITAHELTHTVVVREKDLRSGR